MLFKTRGTSATMLLALAATVVSAPLAHSSDDAPRPGDQTVAQVCSVCHGAGLMGAPRIGDAGAWQTRLSSAGSIERLVESAEHGKGSMPPRGGVSSLTDADLKAAITYMLSKSGG